MATNKLHSTIPEIYKIPDTDRHIDLSLVCEVGDTYNKRFYDSYDIQYYYFYITCNIIGKIEIQNSDSNVLSKIKCEFINTWHKYKSQ